MLELFPHVMLTGLFDRYVEVVETGKPARFEQEYNYDRLTGWFELSVVKWGDGIVLTLVDINDSKKHQQHMEQTNRELLHVNDNLRQFAYVASHDLQEPLRKIIAFGDMLEEQFGSNLGEAGHDIIKRMQIATKRMSALIKDVLAYSRITTHREPFRLIALNDLVEHIKVEFQEEFRDVDTYLEVEELPVVRGDRSQIHQLFSNLLANALKFSPEDRSSVIQISCRSIVGDEGPSELRPNVTYHEITVSDNGIGFDRKHTERIFQVFNDSITDSNTKARA